MSHIIVRKPEITKDRPSIMQAVLELTRIRAQLETVRDQLVDVGGYEDANLSALSETAKGKIDLAHHAVMQSFLALTDIEALAGKVPAAHLSIFTTETLIWWTTNEEGHEIADLINYDSFNHWPEALKSEIRSRQGRNGRGRLWTELAPKINEIEWDDTNPICQVASDCAGIVFEPQYAPFVSQIQGEFGFFTDLNMRLVKFNTAS